MPQVDALLDGGFAEEMADLLGDVYLDCILTRLTFTGPDHDPTPGTPDSFLCKGIIDTETLGERGERGVVSSTNRRVLILSKSLEVEPVAGDYLKVKGKTSRVVAVSTDPAGVLWDCEVAP
jgi:hypothetical protein